MGTENPQENISKPEPAIGKIDNRLCLSGLYPKNSGSFNSGFMKKVNAILHLNK